MPGTHESWGGQVSNSSNHSARYMENPVMLESLGYSMRKSTQYKEVLQNPWNSLVLRRVQENKVYSELDNIKKQTDWVTYQILSIKGKDKCKGVPILNKKKSLCLLSGRKGCFVIFGWRYNLVFVCFLMKSSINHFLSAHSISRVIFPDIHTPCDQFQQKNILI